MKHQLNLLLVFLLMFGLHGCAFDKERINEIQEGEIYLKRLSFICNICVSVLDDMQMVKGFLLTKSELNILYKSEEFHYRLVIKTASEISYQNLILQELDNQQLSSVERMIYIIDALDH